ncbi:Protein priA [Vanrija pseudolonga]|uniref:Protein priA n=1 Tax=Vanrija pseudolonga TaxID=143232 RepID=A0AAF0YHQ7_9TREE|nr:Protein priA [Vanrija pseudolonga]
MLIPVLAALVVGLAATPALGAITPPGPSSYNYIFAGCATPGNIPVYNTYLKVYGLTQAECDVHVTAAPSSSNYKYSFYAPAVDLAKSECYLGNTPPWDGTLQIPEPGDADGSCRVGLVRIGVLKDRPTAGIPYEWTWAGCYAGQTQIDPPAYAGNFFNAPAGTQWGVRLGYLDRSDCLRICSSRLSTLKTTDPADYASTKYAYALLFTEGSPEVQQGEQVHKCICALGPVEGTPAQCEDYNGGEKFTMSYLYAVQINDVIPSAAPNRRREAQRKKQEMLHAKLHAHCPVGYTPCRIALNGDSYECIDTDTELESCGGCLFGEHARRPELRAREAMGRDCTSVMGVVSEAASCRRGTCVTTACRPGYKLVYDHCVQA